uniref:Peptidyl-prolyl cis-trans isomerase n=1 Tax=Rhabditophanes sp. KR3021 TaxID=114890 RepID=A0AC35TFL7_9BILA
MFYILISIVVRSGEFVVELYWKHAPVACKNFSELARRSFYNATIFHRVICGFMIQGGCPLGTGRGGTSIYGKNFDDEIRSDLKHCGAGILSMANSGPNTNSSQFFITLAPTPHLDGKHTIFGRIYSGLNTIQQISKVAVDNHDRPITDVQIMNAFPID